MPYGPPPYPYRYLTPPKTEGYKDGDPIPPGYHVETRMRAGLAIAGGSLFASTYLVSVIGASASDLERRPVFATLYIPVAGPFVMAGVINEDKYEGTDGPNTIVTLLFVTFVLDGLAQVAGVAMFIGGVAADRKILVRNDQGSRAASPAGDSRSQALSIPDLSIGPGSASLRWQF